AAVNNMVRSVLCLLTVALAFVPLLSAPKPRSCPHNRAEICVTTCKYDKDSEGDDKCCPTGCGQILHSDKPGVCPEPRTDIDPRVVRCLSECSTDCECEGNLKCCFNGCGNVCEKPKPKPGSCPSNRAEICVIGCKFDEDCKGDNKCCPTGCGRICQPPVTSNALFSYLLHL
uniref:WAP domain-containing protein n=1 Tax=Periophthalmus magnuspinnatus TaxID=409849 RepID=A0A3B4AW65_9GOBI